MKPNKTAEVIGVGPGHVIAGGNFVPTQLHIGDIVILPTMGFTKFEYEGVSYFIGKENEVLAKINK
jgi:co-chaperonin GroES (HSP10)